MAGYFGKFFDAKDQLAEASQYEQNQPNGKETFSGSSVEAQALEITAARHKMAALEKELREYLLYTGQVGFYEDMMKERRNIQSGKIKSGLQRKAQSRKFYMDCMAIFVGALVGAGVIGVTIGVIGSINICMKLFYSGWVPVATILLLTVIKVVDPNRYKV